MALPNVFWWKGLRVRASWSFPVALKNNRVVNFEGTPDMIGKFVDVEITDVYPNSAR